MKPQKSDSKNIQNSKQIIIAALIIGAAIIFYSCENNIQEIKAFSSPEDLPIIEARNFETLFTDSGKIRFFLKTPKLLRFENDGNTYVEFPEGMELIKYDANKIIISGISSDYAKQFIKEEKWEAKNNVIATNAKGDTLKTEHLIWEEKTERIYTDEFVKIIRADQIITGIGFQSDQNLENWKIKNPKGTIYISVENENNNSTDSLNSLPDSSKTVAQPFTNPLKFQK
ncbi:MAG: LPS export ABC transporter periplasmic protein LptC [Prolixibacteraceae bacterium]|jgi:LPS export ABC transporter protein LptC|nr:LPS export ABC transporter periplasmic protein LptC [Prolixibacteraceae bacterium]MBT6004207.1 LPS export ABC transporter periplasmic protein LptC [Prolixibacteraceae bacterium]MBT6999014.1 LPS export ABC transporter periplasmic protein LptC [Prolixibacteraceae bacterium]MBT7394487.1 LPS export ABC transporter periplasmic protein LptC [Prolixibacteraceae bacterium]